MAVLVTDGVGEGNMGMVTTFCHHNTKPRWRPRKHSLPYISTPLWNQVWL